MSKFKKKKLADQQLSVKRTKLTRYERKEQYRANYLDPRWFHLYNHQRPKTYGRLKAYVSFQ